MRRARFAADFTALALEAAQALVKGGVKLVGIDYLSIEQFGSPQPAVHRTLLGAGIVLVEGLDLADIKQGNYELCCLPLRVMGAEGSPARAILRKA